MSEPLDEHAIPDRDTEARNKPAEIRWTSRKLSPAILLYVLLVFALFMSVSRFVFHSPAAVKSLALAAIAAIVALLPTAGKPKRRSEKCSTGQN